MIIGSQTNYACRNFGDKEGLRLLREAGFESVDLNFFDWSEHIMENDEEAKKFLEAQNERYASMAEYAQKIGIKIGQIHAPFPTLKYDGSNYSGKVRPFIEKSIEIAGIMKCPYIVIHPCFNKKIRYYEYGVEETKAENIAYFSSLFPLFKKYGVRLAVENMWTRDPATNKIIETVCSRPEEMCDYIDTLNALAGFPVAVACLDIGHANLTSDTPWHMIHVLGDRLQVLHVHDTIPENDLHSAPYMGQINWDRTMTALKEVGYSGELSFEADNFYRTFGKDLFKDSARMLYRIGAVLAETHGL